MDLREYFGFPEGSVVTQLYIPSYYEAQKTPCPPNMSFAFAYYKGNIVPKMDTSKVTDMSNMFDHYRGVELDTGDMDTSKVTNMRQMFYYSTSLTSIEGLKTWNVSHVTDMEGMFYTCSNLTSLDVSGWDTSKVTNMKQMFYNCSKLTEIKGLEDLDTSKVTNMEQMFYNSSMTSLIPLDCSGITTKNGYPIYSYSNMGWTDLGGFIGMKMSWDNTYSLSKCPNLTYESCINILNGLYDFTGNGETPNSNQGTLKVHSNFLTLVGDEISIGTNKGWKITA